MPHSKPYIVITSSSINELEKMVAQSISEGYLPFGDIAVTESSISRFLQPMILKDLK